jgi:hypothetical protein
LQRDKTPDVSRPRPARRQPKKRFLTGIVEKSVTAEQAVTRFCYILACMNDSAPQDPRRELQTMLASRLALIVVESREESRVLSLVRE